MGTLWQDIRYGLRMLAKSPGFTAVAVLTLALGMGTNTAIFSLIDGILLRPLPVRDSEHVVLLKWEAHNGPYMRGYSHYRFCHFDENDRERAGCSFSHAFFDRLRRQAAIFSTLTAFVGSPPAPHLERDGHRTAVNTPLVSGDFFETLVVRAALGRTLEPSDDLPSASPVTVLSYGYWQREFGGDRSILGKTIYVDRIPLTIMGVAERDFDHVIPGCAWDMWLPLSLYPRLNTHWSASFDDDDSWWVTIVGRLKPGISLRQAQTAVSLFFRNEMLHGAKPLSKETDDPRISLLPVQKGIVGGRWLYQKPLYILMIVVGIVLLIACSNVGGLLLSRAASRQKEIAVRLAIGAGRARLVRQLLTESVLLSVAGGVLGVLFAYWSLAALRSSDWLGSMHDFAVKLDIRILTFTALVSLLAGILPGLAPAFHGTRLDLAPALKESLPTLPKFSHGRRLTIGSGLVVAQLTLSMLVLAGAGLLVRSLVNLKRIDAGFDTRNLLLVGIDLKDGEYSDQQAQDLYHEFQNRFGLLPGVTSVSYSSTVLLSGSLSARSMRLQGEKDVHMNVLSVGPRFFDTMRIPLTAGRAFMPGDFESKHKVTIVNQAFVRRYLRGRSPLGLHLRGLGSKENPGEEIIGVVGDVKYNDLKQEIYPTAYIPFKSGRANFELRTAATPESLIPAVRSIISQLDTHLPAPDFTTQTEQMDRSLFRERLVAHLSSLFALLALTLASVGLYGLLSYEVTRRTRKMGIRTALGAQRQDVLRLVVGQGIAIAGVGALVGTAGALGLTRYLERQSVLYGVRATDPATFFGVVLLLMFVALLACYLPARRALRVDPIVALRYE